MPLPQPGPGTRHPFDVALQRLYVALKQRSAIRLRVREMHRQLSTKPPPGFPRRVGPATPIPLPAHLPQPDAVQPPVG